jgi:hypothetical protein
MFKTETINAIRNATPKLGISSESTSVSVNMTIRVLITSVNNPKVRILIGIVKSSKTGRIRRLMTPKTTPATKIVPGSAAWTDGKRSVAR